VIASKRTKLLDKRKTLEAESLMPEKQGGISSVRTRVLLNVFQITRLLIPQKGDTILVNLEESPEEDSDCSNSKSPKTQK